MAGIEQELQMKFESEQQKMLLNLIFTSNWLKRNDSDRLAPYGVSPQQYNILRILCGAQGKKMCMHEVLTRMLDRAPNATRLTDKLIAKGLVTRERCAQDRRIVHLRISDKGRDLLNDIHRSTEEVFGSVARKLTVVEAEAINRGLDKMRE